jgi:hypothetical protein
MIINKYCLDELNELSYLILEVFDTGTLQPNTAV